MRPAPAPAGTGRAPRWARAVLVLPAGLALLVGLDAALLLLEPPAPVRTDGLPDVHGMLLVLGFVGTLVALERAVALHHTAGLAAPALLGAGAVLLLVPAPVGLGRAVLLLGTAALTAVHLPLWRRGRDDTVLVQAVGATHAITASILLLGDAPVPGLVPWLTGFVLLTIAGERRELARLGTGPGSAPLLVLFSVGLTAALVSTLLWPDPGYPFLGAVVLGLTGWLAGTDVARRTLHGRGAPRFSAACMLAGYAWLAVAGAVWLLGDPGKGAAYDAVVHAVFLGFTMSVVMAHAPTVLPAALRVPLPYRAAMWVPTVLLHGGLVARIWLGDGLGLERAWQIGGGAGLAALLGFVATAAWSAATAARAHGRLARGGAR